MKLIITGATGFIGQEVLAQALLNPRVTSVVTLTRRPLSSTITTNPKLQSLILEDFSSYPPSIISKLAGADACIWAIGSKTTDVEITRKVRLAYSMTAAEAFNKMAREEGKKFRFVFLSGVLTVRDQKKSVWFAPEARKIGGQAESNILQFSKEHENFEAYVMRPAAVLTKVQTIGNTIRKFGYVVTVGFIRIDELVAVLVDAAIDGSEKETWENTALEKRGKSLINKA